MGEPVDVSVAPRPGRPRCVYCHDDIRGEAIRCDHCGSLVHAECRRELTRCPTIGCSGLLEIERPARTASASTTPAARHEIVHGPWLSWAVAWLCHAGALAIAALIAWACHSTYSKDGEFFLGLTLLFFSPIWLYLGVWTVGAPLSLLTGPLLLRLAPRRYRARHRTVTIQRGDSTEHRHFLDLFDERGRSKLSFREDHYWMPYWVPSIEGDVDAYAMRWGGGVVVVTDDGRSVYVPGVLVSRD